MNAKTAIAAITASLLAATLLAGCDNPKQAILDTPGNIKKAAESGEGKRQACFLLQRNIEEALGEYNDAENKPIKDTKFGTAIGKLAAKGYKTFGADKKTCPDYGEYSVSWNGSAATVTCSKHGHHD